MKHYWLLQKIRLFRWYREIGLHPYIGLILTLVLFFIGSEILFLKLASANWIYACIGIACLSYATSSQYKEWVQTLFDRKTFHLIRVFEYIGLYLPFGLFLLWKGEFWMALGSLVLTFLLSLVSVNPIITRRIPTPFFKIPFEAIRGFRLLWPLIFGACYVTYKGITVPNFGLVIFSMIAILLSVMYSFMTPEHPYFVWIYKSDNRTFLKRKLGYALVAVTVLQLPQILTTAFFFDEYFLYVLVLVFVGWIYLTALILMKYAAYPGDISVPHGILYGFAFLFPPLIFVVMWIFYKKAMNKLELIL